MTVQTKKLEEHLENLRTSQVSPKMADEMDKCLKKLKEVMDEIPTDTEVQEATEVTQMDNVRDRMAIAKSLFQRLMTFGRSAQEVMTLCDVHAV